MQIISIMQEQKQKELKVKSKLEKVHNQIVHIPYFLILQP